MVLARHVCNIDGRVVLAKGAALTAKHIEIFKAWGITEVVIVKEDRGNTLNSPDEPGFDSGITTEVQAETENLFRLANREHPAVRELMQLSAQNKMPKKKKKAPHHAA